VYYKEQERRTKLLFTISGKHIEIPQAVKDYAEEKTDKLPRLYNIINQVEVIIEGKEGINMAVEIIARAEHKKIFVVKEKGSDVYACIDLAIHKLEQQLRKRKTRERESKKHRGRAGKASEV
jgi:putative sigma-54 modulation protein